MALYQRVTGIGLVMVITVLFMAEALRVERPQLPTHLGPPRCYDALLTGGRGTVWLGVVCGSPLGPQIVSRVPQRMRGERR